MCDTIGPVKARRAAQTEGISPLAVLGAVVLVVLLIAGGWAAWQFWGANLVAADDAAESVVSLRDGWSAAPAVPDPDADPEAPPAVSQPAMGEPAWVLRIPRLNLEWPIVAGVDEADLRNGVGWYPSTALPGQAGNFALAGRRTTEGAPFRDLLTLGEGDEVIVETRAAVFTYTITAAPAALTVARSESWVLDPVPGHTDVVPTRALITLTTEEDLAPSDDISVGFGTLTTTETK